MGARHTGVFPRSILPIFISEQPETMRVVKGHGKNSQSYAQEHGEEHVSKEMHAKIEPGQRYQARIYKGNYAHIRIHVEEYRCCRKGRQRMARRERVIPGLLYQKLIVLVEERPVPLGDVLDKEITYHDRQQQCYKDAVTDPGTLVILPA